MATIRKGVLPVFLGLSLSLLFSGSASRVTRTKEASSANGEEVTIKGPLNSLNNLWYDNLMRSVPREVPVDPRILIVDLDDDSLEKIEAPTTFWSPYCAKVIAGLIRAQCQVVGFDYLCNDQENTEIYWSLNPYYPGLATRDERGETEDPWLPVSKATEEFPDKDPKLPRVIQGFHLRPKESKRKSKITGLSLVAATGTGSDGLGLITVDLDSDSVWRSQLLYGREIPEDQRPGPELVRCRTFATRLAESAVGHQIGPEQPKIVTRPAVLDSRSHLRINYLFPGQQKRFEHRSFLTLLNQSGDPKLMDEYAGKIVIIAPTSTVFQDLVTSPVGLVSGVEGHASMVNTLITENYLFEINGEKLWLALLAFCALSHAVAMRGSLGFSASLQILSTSSMILLSIGLFKQSSLLCPTWTLVFGGTISWLISAVTRARQKSQELAKVRHLFGRYVSPQVMETILKDSRQATLGAVGKRKITVLFTDINGFSGECEKRTSGDILDMLNAYFQEMNQIIFRYDGTIKQFVGDEIMAMYGAPAPHPQPEVAAVETALAMMKRLAELKERDPGRKRGFYEIKIGIHSGPVILGNVGSDTRTEYAAVGDDVNLGSRIMGMTKGLECSILVSTEIYEKTRHLPNVRYTPKGSHPVKGRKEPVELFSLEANDELK